MTSVRRRGSEQRLHGHGGLPDTLGLGRQLREGILYLSSSGLFSDDPEYADASLNTTTRGYVENLWSRYSSYAEPDFRSLVRTDFIEKFTEMYVACHLINLGWQVRRTKGAGPDFKAESTSGSFAIEVTAPESGEGRGSVPSTICDGMMHRVPVDEMDFRLANAIERKTGQLRDEAASDPAVLFVNMVRAQHGWLVQEPSLALLALLGIEEMESETSDGVQFVRGHFRRVEYSWLSAVVVARITAWSAARHCHDIVVMHNPLSTMRMPEGAWGSERVREYSAADAERILNDWATNRRERIAEDGADVPR